MFFPKLLTVALASISSVAALATPKVARTNGGGHGDPPQGVTPPQWEGIWAKCENQVQNGLINIGVSACVLAEVEALLAGIIHPKRTDHGDPPKGVTPVQWEAIWADCGKQVQNGLINIGIDACVVAEVEALLAGILHPHKRTNGGHGDPPKGVTPEQWESIWAKCDNQVQNGLINIGVSACVIAEVEALLAGIIHHKRTDGHGEPPKGVTPEQWEWIWADCGNQVQNGLINIGIDACVVAEVQALLAGILHPHKRNGGEHGNPPEGVTPTQWEAIWADCGKQVQNGLINVGIDVCVVAEVEALLAGILHPHKRNGGDHGPPPSGVTPPQWEGIWTKCEDQVQNGLINVGVDVCVVAAVEALLAGIIGH